MDINSKFLKISGSDTIYPYDIKEHISNNPNTYEFLYSFSDETIETLASSSIYLVIENESFPSHTEYQSIVEQTPIQSGSVYIQAYSVEDVDTAEVNEGRLEYIRGKRDELLLETDWVVLPHSPITGSDLDEWIQYRQDLRNITNQENPFEIIWPTKP